MKCPVCGENVDMFDICNNCNYQNSGPKESENEFIHISWIKIWDLP